MARWKSETEGAHCFTDQLAAKVRQLEGFEKEKEAYASAAEHLEKVKKKMESINGEHIVYYFSISFENYAYDGGY